MTRDGDQYVDLDDRVEIARAANASLFISVHADTLSDAAEVSGSTVYTAADRASDAEAARIAARENAADKAPTRRKQARDPGVADILFDLKRRETRAYAHIFSRGLVDSLRGAAQAQSQSGTLSGIRRAEGARISLGAGRAWLPLESPGRPGSDLPRMADPRRPRRMVEAIDAFFAGPAKPGKRFAERGWGGAYKRAGRARQRDIDDLRAMSAPGLLRRPASGGIHALIIDLP